MDNINEGEAMPENLVEDNQAIEIAEILPEEVPMYGVRLKLGNPAKPFIQQFQFAADMKPDEVALELNEFIQMKVEVLAIESPEGKPYFRKSDVLPRRKGTIDILYKGAKVATGLINVPVQPGALFNHNGYGIKKLVEVLVRQAQRQIGRGQRIEVV